ncbi:acyl-CoA dehydrogenase, putative phosphotransferase [hydrothermal vent metagenome]|uniref:Acyl-CoA dehydrogenase, putative phosphotransferase n=1 Tax=hydrothermal vent metagenome TaxID=652676 RepID=A0A3B0RG30_9ZZZZ
MTGTMAVPEKDRLDEANLQKWMEANVEGFAGPMEITKFKGGQSNPTYRIETPDTDYVLRKKPFGKLLPSAHAVDREYRVISGLYPTGFPVAKPYGLCEDDDVLGTMFYIMGMADGRTLWDGTLPDSNPDERRAIYHQMIDTLALLHSYDPVELGLEKHGKPGNYCERQIARWSQQYKLSELEMIPEMNQLIEWLNKTIPEQKAFGIVHGDYRLDNMIFDNNKPEIIAVLDWELSTLGDPIADFAYWLMAYEMEPEGRSGLKDVDLAALGIPSREEAIARYCQKSGIDDLPPMDWYLAYNLFRIAAILQGIQKRVVDGTANSAAAAEMSDRVTPLAQAGWKAAKRAGA